MRVDMKPIVNLTLALAGLPVALRLVSPDAAKVVTDEIPERTLLRVSVEDDGKWYVAWPDDLDRDAVVDAAGVARLVRDIVEPRHPTE